MLSFDIHRTERRDRSSRGNCVRSDQEALGHCVFRAARGKMASDCPLCKIKSLLRLASDSFPGNSACTKALGSIPAALTWRVCKRE